jgi:hypothetical protein
MSWRCRTLLGEKRSGLLSNTERSLGWGKKAMKNFLATAWSREEAMKSFSDHMMREKVVQNFLVTTSSMYGLPKAPKDIHPEDGIRSVCRNVGKP